MHESEIRLTTKSIERGDQKDYSRWYAVYVELFNDLAVIRSLSEGKRSKEERARAAQGFETSLRAIESLVQPEEQKHFLDMIHELSAPHPQEEHTILAFIGDRIRFSADRVRKTAPPLSELEREMEEDEFGGDYQVYEWLQGNDGAYIHAELGRLQSELNGRMQTMNVFGILQQLITLLQKHREQIENDEVDLGEYSVDEAIDVVTHTRDSLIDSVSDEYIEDPRSHIPTLITTADHVTMVKQCQSIAKALSVKKWRCV